MSMKDSTRRLIEQSIDKLYEAQADEDDGQIYLPVTLELRIIIDRLNNLIARG